MLAARSAATRANAFVAGQKVDWKYTILAVVAVGIIGRLILFDDPKQSTLNLAVVAMIYAMVASGIALLYSYGGILSIVHGSLWGIGAYCAATLTVKRTWDPIPVVLFAIVVVAIVAAILASISARLRGSYFVILLFAVAEVIEGIMVNWTQVTDGPAGIIVPRRVDIGSITIMSNRDWYYVTLVSLMLALIYLQAIKRSRLGQQLKAIRDNRDLAISVGINVPRVHMTGFAASGVLAGLAGVYWAFLQGYVVPSQYTPQATITFIVVMLLGGSAYLLGPTVGSIVVIFLPTVLGLGPLISNAVIGLIFIVIILVSPQGIVGIFVTEYKNIANRIRGRSGPPPSSNDHEALDLESTATTGLDPANANLV
jgi:branched-chain amino acid transport system permease protein